MKWVFYITKTKTKIKNLVILRSCLSWIHVSFGKTHMLTSFYSFDLQSLVIVFEFQIQCYIGNDNELLHNMNCTPLELREVMKNTSDKLLLCGVYKGV